MFNTEYPTGKLKIHIHFTSWGVTLTRFSAYWLLVTQSNLWSKPKTIGIIYLTKSIHIASMRRLSLRIFRLKIPAIFKVFTVWTLVTSDDVWPMPKHWESSSQHGLCYETLTGSKNFNSDPATQFKKLEPYRGFHNFIELPQRSRLLQNELNFS